MITDPRKASVHVWWSELECHCTPPTPYPIDLRTTILPRLLTAFEACRALWGQPLRITSGYRTATYNKAIGGAANSQHCKGVAIDFEPPEGVPAKVCYTQIVALCQSRPDLGVGYVCGYAVSPTKPRGQIHLDLGPSRGYEWTDA
jgi:uncharacterized protein YcbK (DUF882 family)